MYQPMLLLSPTSEVKKRLEVLMVLKEEEAATKKKLIGIRCRTHPHKSMESSIKTLAPICETTDLCKLFPFVRRRVSISILIDTRSASKREELIIKCSSGDTLPPVK
ncbi:hypothetical protein V1477_008492 [Vespula maculifrons]